MRTCGMKVFLVVLSLFFLACGLYGQQKYALVIGNAAYTTISPLRNTVNDAEDMKVALEGLGFHVDLVKDGNLETLEAAVERLGANLYRSPGSYGFFYYAGHGVQSGGENYLIPVNVAVRTEARLRYEAVHLQYVLDELRNAGNVLNLVVLDACRDNPFQWARSTARGLTVLGNQPPGSIIVYATSAGSTAADGDGEGRNGVFTGELLKQLKTPGLEVKDLFNRTAAAVQRTSEYRQNPAVYLQFFESAWLGAAPAQADPPVPQPNWTAASDFDLSLEGNGLTITAYKGEDAVVHIPAQVDGIPVTAIGYWAFFDCSSLESITIPNSVTAIGDQAFAWCNSLKSITIPNSVTAIGDQAFAWCNSLKSITIPNSVTAIGDSAFSWCSSLKSITIPNSVTAIGDSAFSWCSSLESITIPNSVTAIGEWAFGGCRSLSNADREAIRRRFGDRVF